MKHKNHLLENCYTAVGPEDGWPILLIHGSVVSKESWLPQLAALSDRFRVIAVDLPGHGGLASIPFSFGSAVKVLADVVRQETGLPVLAVGLSLGGYVAVEFAAAYPDLVRGLIISGCSPCLKGPLGLYLRMVGRLLKTGVLKAKPQAAEERVRRMYSRDQREAAEAQIVAGIFPERLSEVFLEMAGRDFRQHLDRFPGTVFLLNGEFDQAARRGENGFLKTVPLIKVKVVPRAGHAPSLDTTELYNAAVRGIAQQIFGSLEIAANRN